MDTPLFPEWVPRRAGMQYLCKVPPHLGRVTLEWRKGKLIARSITTGEVMIVPTGRPQIDTPPAPR